LSERPQVAGSRGEWRWCRPTCRATGSHAGARLHGGEDVAPVPDGSRAPRRSAECNLLLMCSIATRSSAAAAREAVRSAVPRCDSRTFGRSQRSSSVAIGWGQTTLGSAPRSTSRSKHETPPTIFSA
jgi:hypothetical protein